MIGSAYLLTQARPLNSLLAGGATAVSLGLNVARLRIQMLVVASLLIGMMVAVSGAVAFVRVPFSSGCYVGGRRLPYAPSGLYM